jgi:antitoxin CptB
MNIETPENRLKRLKMRAWRRGTKEMDMILGPFADGNLSTLSGAELDEFDALLHENDQDLYLWVSGKSAPPGQFTSILTKIATATGVK